jgi:hypothetical protein
MGVYYVPVRERYMRRRETVRRVKFFILWKKFGQIT